MSLVLHTAIVCLKANTKVRVHVDHLEGTPDEAVADALAIVADVGKADPEELIARVVASQDVTELGDVLSHTEN